MLTELRRWFVSEEFSKITDCATKFPIEELEIEARFLLGQSWIRLEALDDATKFYEEWLRVEPDNPIAPHMLAVLRGEDQLTQAPQDFIQATGDLTADYFDASAEHRGYAVPALIEAIWEEAIQSSAQSETDSKMRILDLGCGTGLTGERLAKKGCELFGVDLSERMLTQAEQKQNYAAVHRSDMCEYLAKSTEHFDMILAADSLSCTGDLSEFVGRSLELLPTGGWLVFSVEEGPLEDDGYHLVADGRFVHSPPHVIEQLGSNGIQGGTIRRVELFHLQGRPIRGLLTAVQKP